MTVSNLLTKEQLKIESIDLPLAASRTFRPRVNREWARRLPVGSKTTVLRQLRRSWVSH